MLVSPLGSAQSPKWNLQLAASLQPTEEGGPFSAGLGCSLGSASRQALPARSTAGPSLQIVFSRGKGPADFNGEVNAWKRAELGLTWAVTAAVAETQGVLGVGRIL